MTPSALRRVRSILESLDPEELAGWFCAGLEQGNGGTAAAWRARDELRKLEAEADAPRPAPKASR